ncbi:MAG: hypothetical protein ACR2RE_04180 [Geminicoccaceae bacterium]
MAGADQKAPSKQNAILAERKLDIIKTEWSYVQNIIEEEANHKFKNRTWAVTSFSAIFALALYHKDQEIILLTIPICMFFWYIDASRQVIQDIVIEREKDIAAVLRSPTDADLLAFNSPLFGEMLGDKGKHLAHQRKALFGRVRRFFFGSMIAAALMIYVILHFQWIS